MDDGNQAPSWPPICSSEGSWPHVLADPAEPGVCSVPAHADAYLLTLGPDATASAHTYNVALMPHGPHSGREPPGASTQPVSTAYGSILYRLKLPHFIHSVRMCAHL